MLFTEWHAPPAYTTTAFGLRIAVYVCVVLPVLAKNVSTDCKTGTSEVAASETFPGIWGMTHSGRKLPILAPASTMFSACRERPFFPIVAIQNRPLPGPETPHPTTRRRLGTCEIRLDGKDALLWPGVSRSPEFPTRACSTPGAPRPSADADCIGRSVVDSKPQGHNSMRHIIFRL